MAPVSRSALDQLKKRITADWMRALKEDGWIEEGRSGATRRFVTHSIDGAQRRVVIHYHPKKAVWDRSHQDESVSVLANLP